MNKTEKCKGCKKPMHPEQAMNALSKYGHGYICSDCGKREAFTGDIITNNKKYVDMS